MINGTVTLNYLLGPIRDLLGAPQVTEIVCQQPGEVGFENAGKWYWRDVPEFDFRHLDAIGLLAASLLSKNFELGGADLPLDPPGRPAHLSGAPAGGCSGHDLSDDPRSIRDGLHGARRRFRRADARG